MAKAADHIPRYTLYGESSDLPVETVHCETIAARSSAYRWEIARHRHAALTQVLLLASAEADVTLGSATEPLPAPALVVVPAGTVHGFRFQPATQGLVLTFAPDFLAAFPAHDSLAAFLTTAKTARLDRTAMERLLVLGGQALATSEEGAGDEGILLQRALAEALLRTALAAIGSSRAVADQRLRQFRLLVEQHHRQHWPVARYAEALGCTPRTLTRLTRAAWQVSPREVIHQRLAGEARRLLRFSDATAAQIAEQLGFSDPSYFSRFYRRLTGRRPRGDRRPAR